MILNLICFSIFAIPLSSLLQMPGTIVWYPQYMAMIVLGFVLASVLIWRENKPLSILSLYCLFSYVFVCNQHPRALLCVVMAYAGIGLICFVKNINSTSAIHKSLICMAMLQFILVIVQKFNLDPFFHSNANQNLSETVGFLGSHNQLGIYYAAITPMILQFCFPLIVVPIVAILLTHCSSAAIGAMAGAFMFLTIFKLKNIALVILPLVILAVIFWNKFDYPVGAFKERVEIWKLTISQIAKGKVVMNMGEGVNHISTANPLTGFGIGSFIMVSPRSQEHILKDNGSVVVHRYEHAHNDLIEFVFEFGYLGIPIILWILFDVFRAFFVSVKTNMLAMSFCSLLTQAVMSMGVYLIHAPTSYFMLCLTLGLFYAEARNGRTCTQSA